MTRLVTLGWKLKVSNSKSWPGARLFLVELHLRPRADVNMKMLAF